MNLFRILSVFFGDVVFIHMKEIRVYKGNASCGVGVWNPIQSFGLMNFVRKLIFGSGVFFFEKKRREKKKKVLLPIVEYMLKIK